MKDTILIVEDDQDILEVVTILLRREGAGVLKATTGREALEQITKKPDLILLDVMLPDMDGFEVCRRIREVSLAPVLFLTAKASVHDKTEGFEAGGDDYLTKPFALEELLLRINAMAKRGRTILSDKMVFSDLTLDRSACILWRGSASSPLSHRELQLLEFFMQNPHMYFSANTLLDRVWGIDAEVEQGTVWAHISYLRKKFETLGSHAVITSKRGIGYALEEMT